MGLRGPWPVQVEIIGPLRVRVGGATVSGSALGSRRGRMLLCLLALEGGGRVSSDRVVEALWPEGGPAYPHRVVASLVSRLRGLLGPEVIDGDPGGYRLVGRPVVDVDLDHARRLVAEARQRLEHGEPGLATTASSRAVRMLGSGDLIAEQPDAVWAEAGRAECRELLRDGRHLLSEAALEVGDVPRARSAAAAAWAADPLDEAAARLLMAAQAEAGDAAAALLTFDRVRSSLADSLGVDPSGETLHQHLSLLQGQSFRVRLAGARRGPPRAGTSTTSIPSRVGQLRLTGRTAEVEQLCTAWEDAARGNGDVLVVTGPPGAGKTRLAEHLADVAEESGGLVLSARCFEAERSLFLQPFVEAVSPALLLLPPDVLGEVTAGHEATLGSLLPDLAVGVGSQRLEAGSVDVQRLRAFSAVAAVLTRLSQRDPVLLFLDDLHEAGRSSVQLVHYLHRVAARSRLLILATCRDVEGQAVLRALEPVSTRMGLGPLTADEVARLAALAGFPERGADIARRTAGHALFVVELLRDLAAGGGGLPDSLQAAVLARVRRTGRRTQTLLRAGAVLGAAFDPSAAASVAGIPRGSAVAGCELALAADLLRVSGRDYEFANDLIREAVYASIPGPTRVAYHRAAADLLADRPESVAVHAAAAGDTRRAGWSWLVAAENALRRFAAQDAVDIAAHAVDAGRLLRDEELLGHALVVRGGAWEAVGDYEAAYTDYTDAVAAARAARDARMEMSALRALAGDVSVALRGTLADCAPPMRRVLAIAQELGDRASEAEALSRLGELACYRLRFADAAPLLQRAMQVAESTGDERARRAGLVGLMVLNTALGQVQQLQEVTERLDRMLRPAGDLWTLQWTVFNSALVPLAAEDYDAAAALMSDALELNRRSGYAVYECYFLSNLARLHRLRGDLSSAIRLGAEAVARGQESGRGQWWATIAACQHAGHLLRAGRAEDAAALLGNLRPRGPAANDEAHRLLLLAPLAEATGSAQDRAAADSLLRELRTPPGTAWLQGADAQLSLARSWLRDGHTERATEILAPLLAGASRYGWPAVVRQANELS